MAAPRQRPVIGRRTPTVAKIGAAGNPCRVIRAVDGASRHVAGGRRGSPQRRPPQLTIMTPRQISSAHAARASAGRRRHRDSRTFRSRSRLQAGGSRARHLRLRRSRARTANRRSSLRRVSSEIPNVAELGRVGHGARDRDRHAQRDLALIANGFGALAQAVVGFAVDGAASAAVVGAVDIGVGL